MILPLPPPMERWLLSLARNESQLKKVPYGLLEELFLLLKFDNSSPPLPKNLYKNYTKCIQKLDIQIQITDSLYIQIKFFYDNECTKNIAS